jgi:maltoporin
MKGNQYQLTKSDIFGVSQTGVVRTQDNYGIGGGAIWEYDFGNKSMLRISGLWGYGATDFQGNISNQINQIQGAWINQINRAETGRSNTVTTKFGQDFVSVNPVNHASEALATAYFVWNPVDCFALGVWANWEYNDEGFQPVGLNTSANGSSTHVNVAPGSRNIVTVGIRPVYWISDNIAIQGVAAGSYEDNTRNSSGTPAFGKSGQSGIFTIAPTIKPKGGFFTRPEIRLFATYAVWSNSLKGTSASGGNPPYNGNTNQGWLIGSQMEIWF